MHKRTLWVSGLLFMVAPLWAGTHGNHPMSGCGLGYLLFGNPNNSSDVAPESRPAQILAATTNGIYGNQTFGITSGTSGCTQDGAVKLAKQTEMFAEINFVNLRREIATGEGEDVNTFAQLLGASDAKRPQMVEFLKNHFADLFPSPETTSPEMLNTLAEQLAAHPELRA